MAVKKKVAVDPEGNPVVPAAAAAPPAPSASAAPAGQVAPPQNPNLLPGEGANAPTTPSAPATSSTKPNGTKEGTGVWWNNKLYTDPYSFANDLGYGRWQTDPAQAQQFTNFLVANNLLAWASYFTPGDAPKIQPGVDGLTKDIGGGKVAIWFGGADGRWYEDPVELEDALGLHGDPLKAWLSQQPAFSAFFAQGTVTPPGEGQPDGTIDAATKGIWYKGKLYRPDDRIALRGAFPNDDDWRAFLNTNPSFLNWWNDSGGGGAAVVGAGSTAGQQAGDVSSYLGIYGLPPDVQAEVNRIFANTTDLNQAVTTAMAYIRGTPWYAKTYPGINEGIAKGIISNERDYRSYLNQTNQVYHQFANRDVGSDEFANFLREGASLSTIGGRLQGASYASAYGNETQYLAGNFGGERLAPDELQAYGQQQTGLSTDLGMRVQQRLQEAARRAQGIFQGVLANPSLGLGSQGLYSPSLGGGQKPDLPA